MNVQSLYLAIERLDDLEIAFFDWVEIENINQLNPEERIKEYLSDINLFARRHNNLNKERFDKNYKQLLDDLKKFKLNPINDWKESISRETTYWLEFNPHDSGIEISLDEKEKIKSEVLNEVFKYLDNQLIKSSFYIDGGFNAYFTPWGDQMNSDIVCCSKDRIFIFHAGWSS